MPATLQNIQSLVGTPLPYVFIKKVKLSSATARADDIEFITNELKFTKNKYGSNKTFVDIVESNKDFFSNDNVYLSEIHMALNEFFLKNVWYGKHSVKNLKVKVIQSSHPEVTKLIKKSNITDVSDVEEKYRIFIKQEVMEVPIDKLLSDYRTRNLEDVGDVLCSIPLRTRFVSNSHHLTYFAFSYIEGRQGVGQRTIEKVLAKNRKNKNSHTFYLSGGAVWAGPVHYEGSKGWMTGKTTGRRSKPLRREKHLNVKVQDHRVFEILRKEHNFINLSHENTQNKKEFSELLLSRDRNRAARGLFVFDVTEYLRQNSRYNAFFKNVNTSRLLGHGGIKNLRIIRRKKEHKNTNDYDFEIQEDAYELVAETSRVGNQAFLKKKSHFLDANKDGKLDTFVGSVREASLAGLAERKAFTFYDSEIREFDSGIYNYGVEMLIEDPTLPFLESQVALLRKAHSMLGKYYNFANKKQFYNKHTGHFNMQALGLLGKYYNIGGEIRARDTQAGRVPWRRAARIYLNVLKNLTGTSMAGTNLKSNLYAVLAPMSGDLSGVEVFLKLIDSLILRLSEKRNIHASKLGSDVRSRGAGMVGVLRVEHYFEKDFNANLLRGHGIDYYGRYLRYNTSGLAGMTVRDLLERFRKESERTGTQIPSRNNIDEARLFYSRLTPIRLDFSGKSINIESHSSENAPSDLYLAHSNILNVKSNSAGSNTMQEYVGDDAGKKDIIESYFRNIAKNFGASISPLANDTKVRTGDASSVMPGGEMDRFIKSKKEIDRRSSRKSNDKIIDKLSKQIDLETLSKLSGGDSAISDLMIDSAAKIHYVYGFDNNLDVILSDVPVESNEAYLVYIKNNGRGTVSEEESYDEWVLVDSRSGGDNPSRDDNTTERANPDDPTKENPPDETQPPSGDDSTPPEDDQDDPGDPNDPDDPDEPGDSSDSNPDAELNTGADEDIIESDPPREVISRTVTPPVRFVTEQQQTYPVGISPDTTGTGGGSSGY